MELFKDEVVAPSKKYRIFREGGQLMCEYPDPNDSTKTIKNIADVFVDYKIREEYKQLHETLLAHAIGAETIFVKPFRYDDPDGYAKCLVDVTEQLDVLGVVWQKGEKSSKAMKALTNYVDANGGIIPNNTDPVIGKYFDKSGTKPYSNTELYARALLAQFDLQQIVIPMYRANPDLFQIDDLVAYRTKYETLCKQLSQTTNPTEYVIIAKRIAKLQNDELLISKYNQFINSDHPMQEDVEQYRKETLEKRQRLIRIIDILEGKEKPDKYERFPEKPKDVRRKVFGENPIYEQVKTNTGNQFRVLPPSVLV
jgi:hypothetical protein